MKDLAIKTNQFIEKETPEMKKKIYPKVDLPLSFIEKEDIDINDKITLKVKGRIAGMENNEYRKVITIELQEGEITEKKKGKTLIG